ncbi:hypothetical protein, partial [Mycobacterium tuberculosis]
ANRVADVFAARKENPALLAQGESVGVNGGSVVAKSIKDVSIAELQYAYDSAAAGNKVVILGGSGNSGLDLIINGQRFELATVTANSDATVFYAIKRKLESSAPGGTIYE